MEPLYTRRSLYILLVLGFLVSTLFFGLSLVKQRQELREKAAGATVLTLVPNKSQIGIGEEVTIDVRVDSGTDQVIAIDLTINFDPVVFDGISFENTTYLPQILTPATITNGSAHIVFGSTTTEPKQGSGVVAQLVLRSKAQATASQISFSSETRAAGLGQGNTNIIASLIPATISVSTGAVVQTAATSLSFVPTSITVAKGQRFYLPVKMNTDTNQIAGVDLAIVYDQNYLKGIGITKGGFLPQVFTDGTIVDGVAKIVVASEVTQPVRGEGLIAVLELEALQNGTTTVSIDPSTQIAGIGSSQNLLKNYGGISVTISEVVQNPGIGGGCVAAVPSIPSGLTARTGTANKIDLSWSPVDNVTHYGIVYGLSPGVYIYGAANVGNTTQFTVGGLAPSTRYYFAVFAVNDCAASGYSTEANALSSTVTTGGGTIKKASPSPALRASAQPSFVPIDPNNSVNPFLQGGTQPSPTIAPLFVSVPPEAGETASGSGILSLLTPVRLVIIALIVVLGGVILYLIFHKSPVES